MQNATRSSDFVEFTNFDYIIFATIIAISIAIGVYFGIFNRPKTTDDYLLGGKRMGVIPIAFSLVATNVSAVTITGMPAEIYTFGTQYLMSWISAFSASFIIAKIFLPVFYELQLPSVFEYLSLRFDKNVGKIACFLCLSASICVIPLIMYIPALSLNLVSGINIHYITTAMCAICVFYTTLGGLKAVVWSDTIQLVIMYSCIFAILCFGIPFEGGIENVWATAKQADRIHFLNFDLSWYPRMTFWSLWFGMGTVWITVLGINQAAIQRFLSLPSMSSAIKVLYIYCALLVIYEGLCLFSGLVLFARYRECDPYLAGAMKSYDQILPYYVMDTAKNLKGLPGIFIAGIFSAGLSTMSTLLNTSGGMIYKDFLCEVLPLEIQKNHSNLIIKLIVVILGVLCTLVLLWVDQLPRVIEFTSRIDGVIGGPLLGIYALGMLAPRINTKGVISGALSSMAFMIWITIKAREANLRGYGYPPKMFPTCDGCNVKMNTTM